jgi:hypothetical protein
MTGMGSPQWGDGYDAGHADTSTALAAGPGWRKPQHPLPDDLAERCAWLRGYASGIRAAIHDASAEAVTLAAADRNAAALRIAREYGQIDGNHHKTWVIDQMVAALTGQPASGRGIAP